MAQITSSVGLISGIDTGSIISQLIALDSKPIQLLQTQIDSNTAQKQAYTNFNQQLNSLQTIGRALERPQTFAAATAKSSDDNVLTATATPGAAVGSYKFQVAQLVTAQQSVTNGYDSENSLLSAGTITLSLGGGDLKSATSLAALNGGTGVGRGSFAVTDRSGKTAVIDTSAAVTLDDVVQKINTSLDVRVHASVVDNHLVIADQSGVTTGNLTVQDLADGQAAKNLGIVGSVAANTLTGTNINTISTKTSLSGLNDGRGVGTAGGSTDFQATLADGSVIGVTLGSSETLGDVIKAINTAGGTKLTASIDATTNSLKLTDTSGGAGSLSVAATNDSTAAKDLGLLKASTGGVISGTSLVSSLDSTLISSLRGGTGLDLGTISITDRTGASATVDLSGAQSVNDILSRINNAGLTVTASLKDSGNGIQLKDSSGQTGNIVVSDVSSTSAAELGINGTFDSTVEAVSGANLHPQFVSGNTLLDDYNGGKGVTNGSFQISAANGAVATIDNTDGSLKTIGDVIAAINNKHVGVTASINANGNGLLLTDTSGGAGTVKVTNVSGTTGSDLHLTGAATGTTIDGALEKTIAVTATDTLSSAQQKFATLGFGVVANLINDGSGVNSEHLSLTATGSGVAGRVVIDGGTTGLTAQTVVKAQDAAVFFGGGNGAQSLLITNNSNLITGVIPGVNIQLQGVSDSPVTLSVARDPSSIQTQVQSFSDGFNSLVDQITTLTSYDSTTNTGGLLLGDSTTQTIQSELYTALQASVKGAGRYHTLADVGVTLGDGAKIKFDADKFNSAFATDPDAVKQLFTEADKGIGALIDKSLNKLVDPINGVLRRETTTLDNQNTSIQSQIDDLDKLIADKKTRLQQQFANMEQVLAKLQSQQSALSSLTGAKASSSGSSSSSSSSSSSGSSSSSAAA